jgi:hypothetical protein
MLEPCGGHLMKYIDGKKIVPKFFPKIPLYCHHINVNSRLKTDKNPNENM